MIPFTLITAFEPQESWLTHDSHFHGIGHMTRVFILQEILCDQLAAQQIPVNREVTRWAAAAHDVGRVDDGLDLEHGRRSTAWIGDNLQDKMTPEIMDAVSYCVHWHVPSDIEAPVMTTELKVLKDADALDRVRLGDLDPSYLRFDVSNKLIDTAQQLYDLSTQNGQIGNETFGDVVAAAQKLALIAEN